MTADELHRRLRQMAMLQALSTRLLATLEPEEVLIGTVDAARELLACETASVRLDDALVGRETALSGLTSGFVDVSVPLVSRGRALGVLELTCAAPPQADELELLERLAAAAALALQNAHLHQETRRLATTDPLTGLSNYRHFHAQLALEVQRARRMRYALGLLMIDLDHFKLINDRHGHPAGDRALQDVAEVFRRRLRRTDVVARVGGEEFAVILPGDGPEAVVLVAEQLRHAVEQLPRIRTDAAGDATAVTLSIGGASLASEQLNGETLIDCADQALYVAKRNGRNQVRLANTTGSE